MYSDIIQKDIVHVAARALRKERKVVTEIKASGYFDPQWYLDYHEDLHADRSARRDPIGHYLEKGAREGRNPSPRFHTDWYLAENPDVSESGVNPLVHYIRHGKHEGRRPTPLMGSVHEKRPCLKGAKHSRVIYKSRRTHDLSHVGRVKRIDSDIGGHAWRNFSSEFRQSPIQLPKDEASYLHSRGFLPNRMFLYDLPSTQIDDYVSDLQAKLLPYANGSARHIIDNDLLQHQIYGNRVMMETNKKSVPLGRKRRKTIKLLLMLDPARASLTVLSAIALVSSRKLLGNRTGVLKSLKLNPASGQIESLVRYHEEVGVTKKRFLAPWDSAEFMNVWGKIKRDILPPLLKNPIFSFVQVDIDASTGSPALIGIHSEPEVVAFQVHGPLMKSEPALEFIREFGI